MRDKTADYNMSTIFFKDKMIQHQIKVDVTYSTSPLEKKTSTTKEAKNSRKIKLWHVNTNGEK